MAYSHLPWSLAGKLAGAVTLCSLAGSVLAYTPPIGIPDPTWGALHPVDTQAPAVPSQWPDEAAVGAYYIDNSHAAATDNNNPYGSPNKPRRTIPGIIFGPGSYIEVHGNYDKLTARYQVQMNCTEAKPCWIRGVAGQEPVIKSHLFLKNSSYVFVENLHFEGGQSGAFWVDANEGNRSHHIVMRNSVIKDRNYAYNDSGIKISPANGSKIHDVVVYGNQLMNLGTNADWNKGDPDFHAIAPDVFGLDAKSGAELSNVWILNNYCTQISGNCVQLVAQDCKNGSCIDMLHHVYVGNNRAHKNRQAGFWSKQARDVVFSQNTSYDNRSYGGQPGDGMGFQYGPDNIWFLYNRIYDSSYGIRQAQTQDAEGHNAYFIGNLIYDIHPESGSNKSVGDDWRQGVGIAFWRGGMNRYVVNNTITDVNAGIVSARPGPLEITGNVIADIADNDFHISIAQPAEHSPKVTSGLMHDPNVGMRVRWDGSAYTSVSDFKQASQQCARNCVAADPRFENPKDRKYALKQGSPAISQLKILPTDVYARYQGLYGENIRVDMNRADRGAALDFGAFEFVKAGAVSPPNAPVNLMIKTFKR